MVLINFSPFNAFKVKYSSVILEKSYIMALLF